MTHSLSDTSMYDLIDRYANDNDVDISDQDQVSDMYEDLCNWLARELENYVDDMSEEED